MSQRVSIIVCLTLDREAVGPGEDRSAGARVRRTLSALRHQGPDHPFEVIVVSPAGGLGSPEDLGEFAGLVELVSAGEDGRSRLANAGALRARGEVVAFLDAGAIPDPYWLAELIPAFDRPEVGGVGGVVFEPEGRHLAHDFGVCDRLGRRRNERPAQPGVFDRPRSDPFTLFHGSNCAFRRDALERAMGFDELFESDLAVAELCLRLTDLGIILRPLRGAPVHSVAPADCRPEPAPPPDDPFRWVRDLCCFALRHGRPQRPTSEVLGLLTEEVECLNARARAEYRARRWPPSHVDFFAKQSDRALGAGVELGLSKPRSGRPIDRPTGEFREFPPARPSGSRRTYCFLSPSESDANSTRAAMRILAREAARRGDIAHLYVADDARPGPHSESVVWSEGVWLHRVPHRAANRWDHLPISSSQRERLDYADSLYESIRRLRIGRRIDLIVAPALSAAGLFCRQDESLPCTLIGPVPGSERRGGDELALAAWRDGEAVLEGTEPLHSLESAGFFDRAAEWLADRAGSMAGLRFGQFPPGARLRVSMVGAFVEPRDATSNVFREQMEAIGRFAEANDLRLDLRAFVLRSRIDDPRVWTVPDVAALTLDPHFLGSDLIIYHFGYYNPLFESMPLSPRSARRVVTFHGITPPELFPPDARGELVDSFRQAANLLWADQVIVQSDSLVSQLAQMGVPAERISRVPLSVPFRSDGRAEGDRPAPEAGTIRLTYVGRFVPSKGVHDLLDAVTQWRASGPTAPDGSPLVIQVELIGNRQFSDPVYIETMSHTVKRRGLQDVVRFRFDIDEAALRAALRRADVFVMPSYHEGFCVPVIEAFACGSAVISSDAGALPETCGGFGAIYPVGDIAALVDRLRWFAEARVRGQVISERGEESREAWRAALGEYLAGFTREAYRARFCSAVFGGQGPNWDITGSSRDVTGTIHRQALMRLRDGGDPNRGPARPAMPTRLIHALSGGEAEPVAPPPCDRPPCSLTERVFIWLHALRCRLHQTPILGNACRYAKRLIWLPWNFHNLYLELGQNGGLRRRAGEDR